MAWHSILSVTLTWLQGQVTDHMACRKQQRRILTKPHQVRDMFS